MGKHSEYFVTVKPKFENFKSHRDNKAYPTTKDALEAVHHTIRTAGPNSWEAYACADDFEIIEHGIRRRSDIFREKFVENMRTNDVAGGVFLLSVVLGVITLVSSGIAYLLGDTHGSGQGFIAGTVITVGGSMLWLLGVGGGAVMEMPVKNRKKLKRA